MHTNSEIEETGPRFCRNSTSHVHQICRFQIQPDQQLLTPSSYSSLLLFIILIAIGRNYIFFWQVTNTIMLL